MPSGERMVCSINIGDTVDICRLETFSWDWDENQAVKNAEEPKDSITKDYNWLKYLIEPQRDERDCAVDRAISSILPPIVTPEKPQANTVDISLDPLPVSEIHPLLLSNDDTFRDDLKAPKESYTLLFPSMDPKSPNEDRVPAVQSSPSQYHGRDTENFNESHSGSFTFDGAFDMMSKKVVVTRNIFDSEVYNLLRPSLPLPKGLEPVLFVLLHMESSTNIRKSVLNDACEIMNGVLKAASNPLKTSNSSSIWDISGRIVDDWMGGLGKSIDLACLFQESVKMRKRFSVDGDNRLEIFFKRTTTGQSLR